MYQVREDHDMGLLETSSDRWIWEEIDEEGSVTRRSDRRFSTEADAVEDAEKKVGK